MLDCLKENVGQIVATAFLFVQVLGQLPLKFQTPVRGRALTTRVVAGSVCSAERWPLACQKSSSRTCSCMCEVLSQYLPKYNWGNTQNVCWFSDTKTDTKVRGICTWAQPGRAKCGATVVNSPLETQRKFWFLCSHDKDDVNAKFPRSLTTNLCCACPGARVEILLLDIHIGPTFNSYWIATMKEIEHPDFNKKCICEGQTYGMFGNLCLLKAKGHSFISERTLDETDECTSILNRISFESQWHNEARICFQISNCKILLGTYLQPKFHSVASKLILEQYASRAARHHFKVSPKYLKLRKTNLTIPRGDFSYGTRTIREQMAMGIEIYPFQFSETFCRRQWQRLGSDKSPRCAESCVSCIRHLKYRRGTAAYASWGFSPQNKKLVQHMAWYQRRATRVVSHESCRPDFATISAAKRTSASILMKFVPMCGKARTFWLTAWETQLSLSSGGKLVQPTRKTFVLRSQTFFFDSSVAANSKAKLTSGGNTSLFG